MTTVQDLIDFLKTMPPDMPVCYRLFSEQCLLDLSEIVVEELTPSRPDGWVQNFRPDMMNVKYLVLPGN